MAYLPKNKYKVLYTNGETYKLKKTGKPYKGEYIKLTDGRLFAGSDPSDLQGRLIPILKLKTKNILSNSVNNRVYQILNKRRATEQDNYIPIPSEKPIPTLVDYGNEYFNRYISVRLNTKKYQEISEDTFINFSKRPYNKNLNKVFFIKWSLTANNELENTIFLRDLEPTLPGIFDFFPNKREYGIKNGIVRLVTNSRIYIDGSFIDNNLPAAYQIGNSKPNVIDNENVPKNQYCGNCIFHQRGYCTKWEANIKHEFWCRAYKGKYNQEALIDSPVSSPFLSPEAQLPQGVLPQSNIDGGGTDGSGGKSYGGGSGDPIDVNIAPNPKRSGPPPVGGY